MIYTVFISTLIPLCLISLNKPIALLFLFLLGVAISIRGTKIEFSLAFLLAGVAVAGYASYLFALPIPLGKLISLIAIYILHKEKSIFLLIQDKQLLATIFGTTASLFLAYLYGPQTFSCTIKMVNIIYSTIVYLIIFSYFFTLKNFNSTNVALWIFFMLLLYLFLAVHFELQGRLTNMWVIGSIRDSFYALKYSNTVPPVFSYQTIGNAAVLSSILLLSGQTTIEYFKKNFFIYITILITSFGIILISGSRQSLVLFILTTLSLSIAKSKKNAIYLMGTALLLILFSFFVLLKTSSESTVFTSVIHGQSIEEAMNRTVNYNAAMRIIQSEPLLGTGLGGYTIPGAISPGKTTAYAHNLLLELLTETGIVGTCGYLMIWLISYILINKKRRFIQFLSTRTKNGTVTLPLGLFFLIRSMVSGNLVFSVGTFIIFYMLFKYSNQIYNNNEI